MLATTELAVRVFCQGAHVSALLLRWARHAWNMVRSRSETVVMWLVGIVGNVGEFFAMLFLRQLATLVVFSEGVLLLGHLDDML